MKILLINTVPTDKNGITNVIFNYTKMINKNGIVFDYVSINNLKEVYENEIKHNGGVTYILHRNHILTYVFELSRIIKKNKYDIIHIHGNSHTLILELLASKVGGCKVRIVHAHSTKCLSVILHKALQYPFNLLCTHRVACSKEAGRFMYGNFPFTIVNNGIDVQKYVFSLSKRFFIRSLFDIKDDEILLGHVGYFLGIKNQKFIVEILKHLNENGGRYKLILIGDGELRPAVEQLAKDLGVDNKVFFTGNVDNVSDYLNAIDIVVMPSLFEGLPLTLVEQQANGLSCIVSDSITRDADKTGNLIFLALKDGANKWAEVIKNINQKEDRIEKSFKAIKSIKKAGYSIHEEAKKLVYYYEETCVN